VLDGLPTAEEAAAKNKNKNHAAHPRDSKSYSTPTRTLTKGSNSMDTSSITNFTTGKRAIRLGSEE